MVQHYLHKQLEGARESAYLRQVFLHVCSFNHFGVISV